VSYSGVDPVNGVAKTLGGVTVTFDGQAAPLFYVSGGQIDAQLPYETGGHTATNIVITYNNNSSAPVNVPVVAAKPGITGYNGQALILNAVTGAIVDAEHPISRGGYVTLYGTGCGVVSPSVATGMGALALPLSWASKPQAKIAGETPDQAYIGGGPVSTVSIAIQ